MYLLIRCNQRINCISTYPNNKEVVLNGAASFFMEDFYSLLMITYSVEGKAVLLIFELHLPIVIEE